MDTVLESQEPVLRFDPGPADVPRRRTLKVIAQDPSVKRGEKVLLADAQIPFERLEPGPRGLRFHVVDYDPRTRKVGEPADIQPDLIAHASQVDLAGARGVLAQQVYVTAARTLAVWETALGRRLNWRFDSHQLYLVPAAFEAADAYYDPTAQAILFGSFPTVDPGVPGGIVYTALSYDVVAHETTHAILDGMRPRFQEPSLPDQAAFHEALADIVALLSVFSLPEVVEELLGKRGKDGRIPVEDVAPEVLAGRALFGLGEQIGRVTTFHRGAALRQSVQLPPDPSLLQNPIYDEPHVRGEILVAAVARTLLEIWVERLTALRGKDERFDAKRAAEEGAKSADHLLTMCIRAIDYMPAVDVCFSDFLAAIAASDTEIVPDDDHGYRDSLTKTFARFGIVAEPMRRVPADKLTYANIHVEELRTRRDEVYRFLWENADYLDLRIRDYLSVESVLPCTRVGPDGFVVREIAASYIQMLDGSVGELAAIAANDGGTLEIPEGVDPSTELELLGGGALIFDEYGRLKYHHRKQLHAWRRQSARLAYLARHGLKDRRNRFGFSLGTPAGQGFALLHEAGDPREAW